MATSTRFDVTMVLEAINARRRCTYGIVVIDGNEASIGLAEVAPSTTQAIDDVTTTTLVHLTSTTASRTRRGGSSASRFARARDLEELTFLRKVVEQLTTLDDIRGFVLAGKADMKRKLLSQLPNELRSRVEKVVDIDVQAAPASIRKIALQHLALTMSNSHCLHVDVIVQHFLDVVASADLQVKATYGEEETAKAFNLGAVEKLIVSCRHSERKTWENLAAAWNAEAIVVDPCTHVSEQFCKGYGVGALLRWSLEPDLLEMADGIRDDNGTCEAAPEASCAFCDVNSEDDSDDTSTNASTVAIDAVFFEWLEDTLKHELDEASAASLVICAEVILSDTTSSAEERISRTVELLRDEGISEATLLGVQFHATDLGLK
eukprot:TRINITY_DN6778_c0_g2_i2.p1 TRINITY_DN6778_c0_g2~~TRINITY_DN6778_c0_g2_i2.p1  ORF type:complete len:377 (+),score=52.69 TRINITY_DN6778_c0_g2_i2:363-1493(+)